MTASLLQNACGSLRVCKIRNPYPHEPPSALPLGVRAQRRLLPYELLHDEPPLQCVQQGRADRWIYRAAAEPLAPALQMVYFLAAKYASVDPARAFAAFEELDPQLRLRLPLAAERALAEAADLSDAQFGAQMDALVALLCEKRRSLLRPHARAESARLRDGCLLLLRFVLYASAPFVTPFTRRYVSLGLYAALHRRFNHACRPNALALVDAADDDRLKVFALRAIEQGEEVTLAYALPNRDTNGARLELLPRAERQRLLQRRYGFVCVCGLCRQQASSSPSSPSCAPEAPFAERVAEVAQTLFVTETAALRNYFVQLQTRVQTLCSARNPDLSSQEQLLRCLLQTGKLLDKSTYVTPPRDFLSAYACRLVTAVASLPYARLRALFGDRESARRALNGSWTSAHDGYDVFDLQSFVAYLLLDRDEVFYQKRAFEQAQKALQEAATPTSSSSSSSTDDNKSQTPPAGSEASAAEIAREVEARWCADLQFALGYRAATALPWPKVAPGVARLQMGLGAGGLALVRLWVNAELLHARGDEPRWADLGGLLHRVLQQRVGDAASQ